MLSTPYKGLLCFPSPGLIGTGVFGNSPAALPVWTPNSCSHVCLLRGGDGEGPGTAEL